MIIIEKLRYVEKGNFARVEANVRGGSEDFVLFVETTKEYGKYLVTDRADAFLVGILLRAMIDGEDIKCENPVSAELKYMLEKQLMFTLVKHDQRFHHTKIYADITEEPIYNAGGVGTGLSLGLDSFYTIAEMYNPECQSFKLTHLVTFNNGVVGGYYQNNNWDYCAAKIYEHEQKVAEELGLPLVSIDTNLPKFVRLKTDYYDTYWIIMLVMSMGKLFRTYFIASNGEDFSHFNITNTWKSSCECYELLTEYCSTTSTGVRFMSGGGERDRLDKLRRVAEFPVAQKNLQSCFAEHYNCMHCLKCKRNLVCLDALGMLDKFSDVYDIKYYREHRDEYIEYLCQQVQMNNHISDFLKPAYDMLRRREPELIAKFDYTPEKLMKERNELRRQRDVYSTYSAIFRKALSTQDWVVKLRKWFSDKQIKNIIIYGYGGSEATQCLLALSDVLGICISYIVENVQKGTKTKIPRLPESTIEYPVCDAVIICRIDKSMEIKRKLSEFLAVPILDVKDVFEMKD